MRPTTRSMLSGLCLMGVACGVPREIDADADGFRPSEGDCDDGLADVHPGAADIVGDGRDTNCDGIDGEDADGDLAPSLASGGADCDDDDPTIRGPGTPDVVGDAVDQDCDGADGVDGDGDGQASLPTGGVDCDDRNPAILPGAPERCDGFDDDCDRSTSERGLVSVVGGGTFGTVAAAVAASAPGDRINVCADAVAGAISVGHDLTLYGQGGRDEVILSVEDGSALTVTGGQVGLEGLTLSGGTGTLDGGRLRGAGVYLAGGTLTMIDAALRDGLADEGAGAWVGPGATLVLRNVALSGQRATHGAGVAVHGGALDAVGASFDDVVAEGTGAAVYADAADAAAPSVWLHPVLLESMTSTVAEDGALVDVHDGGLHWTGGGVRLARTVGAPVRVDDAGPGAASTVTLSASRFEENHATGGASALVLHAPTVVLDEVTVTGNTGLRAAVVVDTGSLTVGASTWRSNLADAGAGALDADADVVVVSGTTFIGNNVSDGVGGVWLRGASLAVTDVSCGSGHGTVAGGMRLESFAQATLTRVAFTANFGDVAGLSADSPDGALTWVDVDATDNGGDAAGGAAVDVATFSATGGSIDGNDASDGVGGLRVAGEGVTVGLSGTELLRNTGTQAGGLLLDHAQATLDGVVLSSNTADVGGGLRQVGGDASLTGCVIRGNEGTVRGGGVAVEPDGDTSFTQAGGSLRLNLGARGAGLWFGVPPLSTGADSLVLDDVDMGTSPVDNSPDDLAIGDGDAARADLGEHTSLACTPSSGDCTP